MAIGCKHGPEACDECEAAARTGGVVFMESDILPQPGESLADFQTRAEAASQGTTYVPPDPEKIKAIIHDPNMPEPIRQFWRKKFYGEGGAGRKELQQRKLQQEAMSLHNNLRDRVTSKLTDPYGRDHINLREFKGKERKMARRILRQHNKVLKSAATG